MKEVPFVPANVMCRVFAEVLAVRLRDAHLQLAALQEDLDGLENKQE